MNSITLTDSLVRVWRNLRMMKSKNMKGDKWGCSDPYKIDRKIGFQKKLYLCCFKQYKCVAIFLFLKHNLFAFVRAWNGRAQGLRGLQLGLKVMFGIVWLRRRLRVIWGYNRVILGGSGRCIFERPRLKLYKRSSFLDRYFIEECTQKFTEDALCKRKDGPAKKKPLACSSRPIWRVRQFACGEDD